MPRTSRSFLSAVVALGILASVGGCAVVRTPFAEPSPSPSALASSEASATTPSAAPAVTPTPTPTPTEKVKAHFDKTERSIDDPSSYWVVSDKLRPLDPVDWSPSDIIDVDVPHQNPARLRKAAGEALEKMFAAAADEDGGEMQVQSAWRSYDVQVSVYAGWVSSLGQKQADAQSARPGFSEHQTGLAVDISSVPLECTLAACFGDTDQGKWLAENAWRFGYLLRYPADKVDVTGFTYEPWHYRFIGETLATEMHNEGVTTLEEFFDLPDAPDYAGE